MMLGNIKFDQIEENLGYRLDDNDKKIWNKFHNNNANLENMESCFHIFYLPTVIVFKGEAAKKAILKMFTENKLVNPCGEIKVYEKRRKNK
jgi:hypothetical protein